MCSEVTYEWAFPPIFLGHLVFHISMLKKIHSDENYLVQWDTVLFDESLSYEEDHLVILYREVRKLTSKEIPSIKVQWKDHLV